MVTGTGSVVSPRGLRVLVTGADGFIGSHLAERLVAEGARVRAFCFYNSRGSSGWLDEAPSEVRRSLDLWFGDIRDSRRVEESAQGVDVIIHLAALIAIPYSYEAPDSFVETNVRGTLNVLEAARRCEVKRVVHTSTSEVYGTPDSIPIRETHPLNAQSPYAASKVAADQMAHAYYKSFSTPVTVLRPFNTYGPRQSARAVIPTMLLQLLDGRPEVELGRLDTRRDFTFVSDTVAGFIRAATIPKLEGRTVQLGTGQAVSVLELFHTACRALGREARLKSDPRRLRPEASEVLVLESDPSLARDLLGWGPTVSLEEGLKRTAEWLEANRSSYRATFEHA